MVNSGLLLPEAVAVAAVVVPSVRSAPVTSLAFCDFLHTQLEQSASLKGRHTKIRIRGGFWIHQLGEITLELSNNCVRREFSQEIASVANKVKMMAPSKPHKDSIAQHDSFRCLEWGCWHLCGVNCILQWQIHDAMVARPRAVRDENWVSEILLQKNRGPSQKIHSLGRFTHSGARQT